MRCDTWRRSWRRLGRTPHSAVSSAAAPNVHADVGGMVFFFASMHGASRFCSYRPSECWQ
jgi:hypothetical protein